MIKLDTFYFKIDIKKIERGRSVDLSLFMRVLCKKARIMIVEILRSRELWPPSKYGDVEIAKSDNEGNVHSP